VDEGAEEAVAASKAPVEVTADDLMDDEWGPVKEKKGKKDKKGKSKKTKDVDEEEDEPEQDVPKGQLSFVS
jgi:translation initiation factor 5B